MPVINAAQRDAILEISGKYGVSNIRVFGSVARGDDTPESDLDLLIDMEKGRSLFDYLRFSRELEALLGHKVDVVEEAATIHPIIRERIMAECKPLEGLV